MIEEKQPEAPEGDSKVLNAIDQLSARMNALEGRDSEGRGEEEGNAGKDMEEEIMPFDPIPDPSGATQYMVLQVNGAKEILWDWTRFHS